MDEIFDLERAKRFAGREFYFKENGRKIEGKVISAQLDFDEYLIECASLILKTTTGEVINALIYSDRNIKIKRKKR